MSGWPFAIAIVFLVLALLKSSTEQVTPGMFRIWLMILVAEAVLPIAIHFGTRTHAGLEKALMLGAGLLLLASTFIVFVVYAPDLREVAEES